MYTINQIARGLKTNKTMTVGILIPSLELGAAKEAVKKVVREKIRLCLCSGFADELRKQLTEE